MNEMYKKILSSQWKLDTAKICPECGLMYWHDLRCQYVADEKHRMDQDEIEYWENIYKSFSK